MRTGEALVAPERADLRFSMLRGRKLFVLCLVQFIVILGFHILYSVVYCSDDQTRNLIIWSVGALLILAFCFEIFQKRLSLILYSTMVLFIATVTYIGYVLKTLSFGVLIFFMASIVIAIFIEKKYVFIWGISTTLCCLLYVLIWPDVVFSMAPNLLLYIGYIVAYIIGEVNLYLLVSQAQSSLESLRAANDEKERSNKGKNIFWANISKEIRTPMNVINGMSSLLKAENLNVRAREYTEQIENASGMLLSIVNDTLELSNIETGAYVSKDVSYDFYNEIHTAVMVASESIKTSSVNMVYCINPRVPQVLSGNVDFIFKFIVKLLTNAVIFTEQGEIRVDVDIDESKSTDTDVMLIIRVSDSGSPIASSEDDVFSGFDAFATGKSAEQESLGLSLKLSKAMVEFLGGDISVSSNEGKGNIFTVRLRQNISSEYELQVVNKDEKSRQGAWLAPDSNVLVVDDTLTNLKLISGMIKLHGIEPDVASSGKEAISMMEKKKYDLVFMDYMMPEMNGVDTLKQINVRRGAKNFADVKVIALTSRSLVRDRAKFIELGFDEFIAKPIDDRELENLLRRFLTR